MYILIAVTVILAGMTTWLAIKNCQEAKNNNSITNQTEKENANTDQKDNNTTTPSEPPAETPAQNLDGYLVVKELGIKIKIDNADKFGYILTDYRNYVQFVRPNEDNLKVDVRIEPLVMPGYLENQDCATLGIFVYRIAPNTPVPMGTKEIANAYWTITGSPWYCENNDDKIRIPAIDNFTTDANVIEAL